jgi:predicted nucleotidyltransferase component of viral defense system
MRYATAAAFRTALEQRLLASSRQTAVPLALLRKLVAFERLLARLLVVAPDRWVLKGAVALHFRLGARFRATKDMDLGRWDDERAAAEDFDAAVQVDLGDHFRFAVVRTDKLDQLLEGAAVRCHVSAYLAGRRFEELTVDVGFGDPQPVAPERLRGPDLLSFVEIAPIEVPALPLAPHVAEKVHAYTRSYAGGRASTRVRTSSTWS